MFAKGLHLRAAWMRPSLAGKRSCRRLREQEFLRQTRMERLAELLRLLAPLIASLLRKHPIASIRMIAPMPHILHLLQIQILGVPIQQAGDRPIVEARRHKAPLIR